MDPGQEFRRHAEECRRMARSTAELEAKATWNRMAERWLQCAEVAEKAASGAQAQAASRRGQRPIYRWAEGSRG